MYNTGRPNRHHTTHYLSTARVNATEYESGIVVECECTLDGYAVPAWEEHGYADLCGPFATEYEAGAALEAAKVNFYSHV